MRCVRCDRPLSHPAKTIDSKHGPLMWGPVCALKAGLIDPKPRQRALITHHQAQEVNENQMALELTA